MTVQGKRARNDQIKGSPEKTAWILLNASQRCDPDPRKPYKISEATGNVMTFRQCSARCLPFKKGTISSETRSEEKPGSGALGQGLGWPTIAVGRDPARD